jgi:hypothetical protein
LEHAYAETSGRGGYDVNESREGKPLIDGGRWAASGRGTFDVINPADESFAGTTV